MDNNTHYKAKVLSILAVALFCAIPTLAQDGVDACGRTRAEIEASLSDGQSAEALSAQHEECMQGFSNYKVQNTTATGSVFWEEIEACGYHPQRRELQCAIEVYQPTGFAGTPGIGPGSWEWVQFCVNYGAGMVPVNLSAVHIHDEAFGAAPPWFYAVNVAADPTLHQALVNGQTLQARAILSWTNIPNGCNYVPVWGNQADFQIKLDP